MTEQDTVRQSVQERQSHQQRVSPPIVLWSPRGTTPINEFRTEGYTSCTFSTLFPTGAADFVALQPFQVRLLGTTSSISSCTKMVDLSDILTSATSLSTRSCAGGHCRQVVSTFASTRLMPNSHGRGAPRLAWIHPSSPPHLIDRKEEGLSPGYSETWSVVKGKFSLIAYCTMLPLCVEPGSTGSSSAAASFMRP